VERGGGQNGPIPPTTVHDYQVFLRAFQSRHWPDFIWKDYRAESKQYTDSKVIDRKNVRADIKW